MDLNYNTVTWGMSLRNMCMVKICQEILEASTHPSSKMSKEMLLLVAAAKVDQLKLPKDCKNKIKTLLWPICDEMMRWDAQNVFNVRPVLTPLGTVDRVKSTRAAVETCKDDAMDILMRFALACKNCHEEHILKLGRLMVTRGEDCFRRSDGTHPLTPSGNTMTTYWYNLYQGRFERMITHRELTVQHCEVGLCIAIREGHCVAIEYFGGRVSQASWQQIIAYCLHDYNSHLLSPATFTFLYSRMSESLRKTKMHCFAVGLLNTLVHWPYQHLFLEAAKQLAEHLSAYEYWKIAVNLLRKSDTGFKETNYLDLFVGFWQLRAPHMPTSIVNHQLSEYTVFYVFLMCDVRITDMVLADVSPQDRVDMLMRFHKNKICMQLTKERRYDSLELLIRACGMGRKDVLVAFRQYFVTNAPRTPILDTLRVNMLPFHEWQWIACIEEITNLIDRIIAETDPTPLNDSTTEVTSSAA